MKGKLMFAFHLILTCMQTTRWCFGSLDILLFLLSGETKGNETTEQDKSIFSKHVRFLIQTDVTAAAASQRTQARRLAGDTINKHYNRIKQLSDPRSPSLSPPPTRASCGSLVPPIRRVSDDDASYCWRATGGRT